MLSTRAVVFRSSTRSVLLRGLRAHISTSRLFHVVERSAVNGGTTAVPLPGSGLEKIILLSAPGSAADLATVQVPPVSCPRRPGNNIRKIGLYSRRVIQLLMIFTPLMISGLYALVMDEWAWWWNRATRTLERAGPSFVKLGQWASTRRDLFGPEICGHLSRLQTRSRAHAFHHTKACVQYSFGKPIDEIFDAFDPTPVASGAIAQVHRAFIDGVEVAVKVRHPRTVALMEADVVILNWVANLINLIPGMNYVDTVGAINQFSENLLCQVDLSREAEHLSQFAENFKRRKTPIHVPVPVYPYVKPAILVESFERGEPVLDFVGANPALKEEIGRRVIECFLEMLFYDNFVHGDMHPGNILCRKSETGKAEIVLLDAGLVTTLPPKEQRNLYALLEAVASGDGRRGAALMLLYSKHENCKDPEQFVDEMNAQFESVTSKPLSRVALGQTFQEIMNVVRKHQVTLESNFASLLVGIFVIEGLGRQLNPNLNLLKAVVPYVLTDDARDKIDVWAILKRRAAEKLPM